MNEVFYVLTTRGTDIYGNNRDFYLTQDDIGSAYFAPRFSDNVIRFEEDSLHEVLAKPYTNKYMIYNLLSDLKYEAEEYKRKTGNSYWVTYEHIYLKKVVILNEPVDSFHFENKTVVYDNAYLEVTENE